MIAILVEVYIQISEDPNLSSLLQLSGGHFAYERDANSPDGACVLVWAQALKGKLRDRQGVGLGGG